MKFHRWALKRVETLEDKAEKAHRVITRSAYNRSTTDYLIAQVNYGRWTVEKSLLRKYLNWEGWNV